MKYLFAGILCLVSFTGVNAQDSTAQAEPKARNWQLSGYVKDFQTVQFVKSKDPWLTDALIHNRLDFAWFPSDKWQLHLGMRNRLLYGATAAYYAADDKLLSQENGDIHLSKTLAKGDSYVLHSMFDRASLDFTAGKWQISLGRQRINWGMNLVWNPNDVFNAFSWFDFDYEERPGSDALRVQYYMGSTSSAEIAWAPAKKWSESTLGGLYKLNTHGYDIQFLAAHHKRDFVLGSGWSGNLGQAGFNGEISGFIPEKGGENTEVSASLGVNYTFSNSLFLHAAYLLNSSGTHKGNGIGAVLLTQPAGAKNLMPGKHTVFSEVAYQITPLVRANISGMYLPGDNSWFLGPFLTVSLSDNWQLLGAGQFFFGSSDSLFGPYGKLFYLRLKWGF